MHSQRFRNHGSANAILSMAMPFQLLFPLLNFLFSLKLIVSHSSICLMFRLFSRTQANSSSLSEYPLWTIRGISQPTVLSFRKVSPKPLSSSLNCLPWKPVRQVHPSLPSRNSSYLPLCWTCCFLYLISSPFSYSLALPGPSVAFWEVNFFLRTYLKILILRTPLVETWVENNRVLSDVSNSSDSNDFT